MMATSVAGVMRQYGVRNMSVRDNLYRAVVIPQLFFGQYIGMVTVYVPVDPH